MYQDEKTLSGFIIAVLAADGVDENQTRALVDALHRRGATLHAISLERGTVRSTGPGILRSRAAVGAVSGRYYDAVVIPEGDASVMTLLGSDEASLFLLRMRKERRLIAALGRAVELILNSGLARGRRIAAPPELAGQVIRAGARPAGTDIHRGRYLVTARSGVDIEAFCDELAMECREARRRDFVDEASRDSFPASDAPSTGPAI